MKKQNFNKTKFPFSKILYLVFFIISSCSATKTLPTTLTQQAKTPVIDGVLELEQNLVAANVAGIHYNIQSTAQYLYIGVKISSNTLQDHIFRYGMGVFVDTTGKQKNLMGIQFPLKLSEEEQNTLQRQSQSMTLEKAYTELAREFEMVGFAPEPLKATNTSSQHFKAAVGFNELGNIICEYQIPWKAVYQNRNLGSVENIALKIQVNQQDIIDRDGQSDHNPLGNSITQGQHNMQHNNPNANMGRNPYANPMGGARNMPQNNKIPDYSTWIKLSINEQ